MLILRRPWATQPQQAVALRRNSALLHGVISVSSAAAGPRDLVSGAVLPRTGSPSIVPNLGGQGYVATSGTAYWATPDMYSRTHPGVGTGEASVLMICCNADTSDQGFITCTGAGNSDAYPFSNLIYSSTFATVRWINGAASKVPLTIPHVVVIRAKLGQRDFFQNGLLLGTSSSGTVYTYNGGVGIHLGRSLDGMLSTSRFNLVVVWDRYLSDAEVAATKTPALAWDAFFEPRRIIVPVAAAASGLPTLSNARGASVTTTSFQPAVDYAY